jgi:hypothetical protein
MSEPEIPNRRSENAVNIRTRSQGETMSDFSSEFVIFYVVIITIVSTGACAILLRNHLLSNIAAGAAADER